jgi:uncharacterized protein YjbJ (UPF0337 family)
VFALGLSGTRNAQLMFARRWKMGEFIDKAKGKVKQAAGDLTGSKKLKEEGERDELKGELKGVVKDLKYAIKDATK